MSLRYNPDNPNHLRDATHAHNLYVLNNFANAPKNKFLYHVVFALKDDEVRKLAPTTSENLKLIGVLAKAVDLPGFKVSVDTKQQYNRKKNYQTRIDYDECRLVFHDDNTGLTTTMLREYYNFFYRDGIFNNKNNYGTRNKYGEHRHRYGLDNNSRDTFFDFIRIYQLSRKEWLSFTLVNPILTAWNHDSLDYSDASGVMENTINVAYEAVLYNNGQIDTNNEGNNTIIDRSQNEPIGFASEGTYYDLTSSPLISNGEQSREGPKTAPATNRADQAVQEYLKNSVTNTADLLPADLRGPSPVVKEDTQNSPTLATPLTINQLPSVTPLSPETISTELEADQALKDALLEQSVLTGQVEGFDSTNATSFESLSADAKTSMQNAVVARATSTDRTKTENVKAAKTATVVIEKKKISRGTTTTRTRTGGDATTREVDFESLYPPPTPKERAEEIDSDIKRKTKFLNAQKNILERAKPGGPLEGARTPEQLASMRERVNKLEGDIELLQAERSFLP